MFIVVILQNEADEPYPLKQATNFYLQYFLLQRNTYS